MNWLKKLPGYQRSPPGLEWALWKQLPAAFAWCTGLPILAGLVFWFSQPAEMSWVEDGAAMLVIFKLIGLVVFFWTLLLTVAIGCIVVMVMKGPAYVADGYEHPESEQKKGE